MMRIIPILALISICAIMTITKGQVNPTWQTEVNWILATQRENGAWPITKVGEWIAPYITNIALNNVLRLNTNYTVTRQVKRWIQWYISHLNDDGTMYDWFISPSGQEHTEYKYDSTDSYAATFLSLVTKYYYASADRAFIKSQMATLRKIAHAILATFNDRLWLTYAKPSWEEYYLMDNVEVWKGLTDYSHLLADLLDTDEAFWWGQKAEAVRTGIESRLYDPSRGYYRFHLVKADESANPTNWSRYYADAVANIYTQVYKLPEGMEPTRRARIYNLFKVNVMERWVNRIYIRNPPQGFNNDFPDSYVSEAVRINGDTTNLNRWKDNVLRLWFPHRSYTYTIGDASYLGLRFFEEATAP